MSSQVRLPRSSFSKDNWQLVRHVVVVAVLTLALVGCTEEPAEQPPSSISVAQDLLQSRDVLDVQRVDTDSDGALEWLAFYRFDQVGDQGPVAAIVYDVVYDPVAQLPVVYPYRLRTPAQNSLARSVPLVTLVDVVPETDRVARKELLLSTGIELAFFRLTRDPGAPIDNPPLYRCIGFFRSADGVQFDASSNRVSVTSRAGYERSELVTRYYYRPSGDGYFVPGTEALVAPFASGVDFPSGIPEAILDTPYPEKIVLAFYKTFQETDTDSKLVQYLTTQAAVDFMRDNLRYGSPFPRAAVKFATVKELSYFATQEDSQSTLVIAKVVFTSSTDATSALTEVRWKLVRIDGKWRMDFPES